MQSVKINSSPAEQKKTLGIQAFTHRSTVTEIANRNNTSRKLIYNQKK